MSAGSAKNNNRARRRGKSAANGGGDAPHPSTTTTRAAMRRARAPEAEVTAALPASVYRQVSPIRTKFAVPMKPLMSGLRHSKIQRAPLHNEIVRILRQEIISAKWLPGQRLPESLLCERFGVSRTPLRDALKVLTGEGLVELTHNAGAVVTHPRPEDIEGKLAIIELLQCYAAREACAKASEAELRHILKLHRQMGVALARRDMSRNYRLNNEVHAAIVKASHNSTLVDLHANLWQHVERLRFLALVHPDLSVDSWAEHEAFVGAIVARNAAAASSNLRGHLRRVARKINKELQKQEPPDVPHSR
jgi:DNA-binding GntR family transcriptional regulator